MSITKPVKSAKSKSQQKSNFNSWRKNQVDRYKGTILDFSIAKKTKTEEDEMVYIVDAIMGAGKTTAAINFMNDLPRNVKVIYITPYLDEIQRIIKSCPSRKFVEPKEKINSTTNKTYRGKMSDFLEKIERGCNIVCTHALFHNLKPDDVEVIKANNYLLIMDEVADVIEQVKISKYDIKIILKTEQLAEMDEETKEIKWKDWDYRGRFEEYMYQSKMGCLFGYGNINAQNNDEIIEDIELLEDDGVETDNKEENSICPSMLMWNYPATIYKAFRKIFILTYMFEGQMQCGYLKYHNLQYKYLHVNKEEVNINGETKIDYNFEPILYDNPQYFDTSMYQSLIHLEEGASKINMIGYRAKFSKTVPLSKNWFKKSIAQHRTLKNNISNYFKHITDFEPKGTYRMWTTFKSYKDILKGNGYSNGFIPLNARATNQYKDKYILAYIADRYPLTPITNFLAQKKVYIDKDQFALSEMLQWIFRSRIRDGKEIWIYIPSLRMRNLLRGWMGLDLEDEW